MSDYETTQRRRNITVGIFVVVALCAIVGLIAKFGDLPVFVGQLKSYQVSVRFPTASGVEQNTSVRFCGYQIGRVTNIRPPKVMENLKTGQIYHQTIVILSIDKEYKTIPDDVEVKLMTRGLGSSFIELKEQPYDVNSPHGEFLTNGSELQGSTGMTSEFFPAESQEKLDKLADGLGTLIKNANDILGDPNNKENLKTALANLSDVTKQAKETLKNADARVEEVVAAMVGTSEELNQTLKQFRLILEKVNEGQGTAGKLINDGRLYEELLESTRQLQVLLQEAKELLEKYRKKGIKVKL